MKQEALASYSLDHTEDSPCFWEYLWAAAFSADPLRTYRRKKFIFSAHSAGPTPRASIGSRHHLLACILWVVLRMYPLGRAMIFSRVSFESCSARIHWVAPSPSGVYPFGSCFARIHWVAPSPSGVYPLGRALHVSIGPHHHLLACILWAVLCTYPLGRAMAFWRVSLGSCSACIHRVAPSSSCVSPLGRALHVSIGSRHRLLACILWVVLCTYPSGRVIIFWRVSFGS